MKNAFVLVVAALLLCCGCATPSYVATTWDGNTGKKIHEVLKYENSTFYSGKALLFEVTYSPETYSPRIRIGYGRYESARVLHGQTYDSDYGLTDVNLWAGSGSANHHVKIGFETVITPEPEVKK